MSAVIDNFKCFFRKLISFLPTRLPNGVSEFHEWVASIRNTWSLPTDDENTIRFAFSTMIMHLGPTVAYRSKFYFVLAFRAAAAKQIAGEVFRQVKEAQTKESAEQKSTAEVTANPVTSNGSQQPKVQGP